MTSLLRWYRTMVDKYPYRTQIIASGILTSTGDLIAQTIEKRSLKYDLKRTAVMAGFGFCYFGPIISTWLAFLKRRNTGAVASILFDQFAAAVTVNAGFVFFHPLLSGSSLKDARSKFSETAVDVQLKAWTVWIPAQAINFTLVPYQFRVLYIQGLQLFWIAYLSNRAQLALASRCDA